MGPLSFYRCRYFVLIYHRDKNCHQSKPHVLTSHTSRTCRRTSRSPHRVADVNIAFYFPARAWNEEHSRTFGIVAKKPSPETKI